MKRTLTQLIVLVTMMFIPNMAKADGWEKTVTNDKEWKEALDAVAGVPGESYVINIAWDENTPINTTTRWKPTITSGRIVIRSSETDFSKMPALKINFDWAADLVDNGPGKNLSLIFENLNLQFETGNTGGGQIIYFNGKIAPIDTIAYRHCDINNYGRLIFRSVPKEGNIENQTEDNLKILDVFDLRDSRIHDGNILTNNNWYVIRFGQPFNTLNIENNMFYDLPYTTGIFEIQKVKELGNNPVVNFNNNTVLLAQNKTLANKGFTVMNPGANLGATATYNFNNNIFMAPQVGLRTLVGTDENGDPTTYDGKAKIMNADGGIVVENRNVVDPLGYQGWAADNYTKDVELNNERWSIFLPGGNDLTAEEAGFGDWTEGAVFQDPANSIYTMQKSHKAYTMGVVLDENGSVIEGQNTCLGASIMYTDQAFPTKATVNIELDGPSYVTYSIEPVKTVYYIGDEIKLTLTDQNSKYRKFTEFKGWSDGNTDMVRTITLDGDLSLTAKFEEMTGIISAFTFPTAPEAGNNKLVNYDANIYADEAYKATANVMIYADGAYKDVDGTENRFNWRSNKFGEDDDDSRMCILSRKSDSEVRAAGNPDFLKFTFSTKDCEGISFSAFVGTDNMGYKTQKADYSLDGITWTNFASVELEGRDATFGEGAGKLWGWSELKGDLPAEANNKDVVYVRIIGDTTSDIVDAVIAGTDHEGIMFEYTGNVLITCKNGGTNGINNVQMNNQEGNDSIYNLMGIKVGKNAKGLLIKNGKKYFVK